MAQNIKVPSAPPPFGPSPEPDPGNKNRLWDNTNMGHRGPMPVMTTTTGNVTDNTVGGSTFAKGVGGPCQILNAKSTENAPMHGISKCKKFWIDELASHPDKEFKEKIVEYVTEGAPIGYEGILELKEPKNWPSAKKFSKEVDEFVIKHWKNGAIEGPFELGKEVIVTSPLGAFIKKGKEKVRVIHDLSYPRGNSVNSGIDKNESSVEYTSVIQGAKMCMQYKTPFLAKYDLQDAYLSCPVKLEDRKYLGFLWQPENDPERVMRFSSLPFGLRSSAKKFSDIAEALMYICKKHGTVNSSIYYLDDALTVSESYASCKASLDTMVSTAKQCGFKVNDKKTVGPDRRLEFLGVELDTVSKQMKMSQSRIQEINEEISEWETRKTCTKKNNCSACSAN